MRVRSIGPQPKLDSSQVVKIHTGLNLIDLLLNLPLIGKGRGCTLVLTLLIAILIVGPGLSLTAPSILNLSVPSGE